MDLLFEFAGLCFIIFWSMRYVIRMHKLRESKHWPSTEATIQTAEIETVTTSRSGATRLPCFAFTYQVGQEVYSGRFSLEAWGEEAERLIVTLINKKLTVQFHPGKSQVWHIPLEMYAGCFLHQKLEFSIGKLYPDD